MTCWERSSTTKRRRGLLGEVEVEVDGGAVVEVEVEVPRGAFKLCSTSFSVAGSSISITVGGAAPSTYSTSATFVFSHRLARSSLFFLYSLVHRDGDVPTCIQSAKCRSVRHVPLSALICARYGNLRFLLHVVSPHVSSR